MSKSILSLSAFLLATATVFALAIGPNITFTKTSHSFGKIPQGRPVSYEFEFTNNGDQPLIIKNVKASCGCTTPSYPTEPIGPGEKEKIKAVFNASSAGNFHKSITITSNIKEPNGVDKKIILFIKGEVIADKFKNGGEKPSSPVRIN